MSEYGKAMSIYHLKSTMTRRDRVRIIRFMSGALFTVPASLWMLALLVESGQGYGHSLVQVAVMAGLLVCSALLSCMYVYLTVRIVARSKLRLSAEQKTTLIR